MRCRAGRQSLKRLRGAWLVLPSRHDVAFAWHPPYLPRLAMRVSISLDFQTVTRGDSLIPGGNLPSFTPFHQPLRLMPMRWVMWGSTRRRLSGCFWVAVAGMVGSFVAALQKTKTPTNTPVPQNRSVVIRSKSRRWETSKAFEFWRSRRLLVFHHLGPSPFLAGAFAFCGRLLASSRRRRKV